MMSIKLVGRLLIVDHFLLLIKPKITLFSFRFYTRIVLITNLNYSSINLVKNENFIYAIAKALPRNDVYGMLLAYTLCTIYN